MKERAGNLSATFLALLLILGACDAGEGEGSRDTLAGREDAITECIKLCEFNISNEADLSQGPCLNEEVVEDWACDIINVPPQEADELPANQCEDHPDLVEHIVSLDPDCKLLGAS